MLGDDGKTSPKVAMNLNNAQSQIAVFPLAVSHTDGTATFHLYTPVQAPPVSRLGLGLKLYNRPSGNLTVGERLTGVVDLVERVAPCNEPVKR